MKRIVLIIATLCLMATGCSQTSSTIKNQNKMKLNIGIITDKITETKAFYTATLVFGITFQTEFYLLLHTPTHDAGLSLLLPNHLCPQPHFHSAFQNQGRYLTIEVDYVDSIYQELKQKGVE